MEGWSGELGPRYRLEGKLGQGGMATVYLAHDLKHDRKVAIKVLRPELAAALGSERFLREITTTARLDHPNIVPLLDSGEADGSLYYVMPFVAGESLRDRLVRERQLSLDLALQITREVADALDYAYHHGLIHRDIKPENILLSDGHARVADFGISRAIDVAGGEKLTESGLVLGTPAYMSPEQSMAEAALDGRSDLYSLGCVLFEMLAGETPYDGPTAQAIIAKRMTQPVPSIRTLRETVPEPVDRALTRLLAKSPADRFGSGASLVEALGSAADPPVSHPVAVSRTGRRLPVALPVALAVGAVALTIALAWLVARARRPAVEPSISVIAVLPLSSSGDTGLMRLGRDLALTVGASLDGVGGIRTIDPHRIASSATESSGPASEVAVLARKLGAGSVMQGNIVRVGSEVRLDLKLVAANGDSAPLARVTVSNEPDSIGALTDSITWAMLRQIWRAGDPPSPSYTALTTRSLQSLRAFLDGERLSVAGRFAEASDAYAAAIMADSSFWLAGWRYNSVQGWLEGESDSMLARGYETHLAAFGNRDRALIEANLDGDKISEAEYLARQRKIAERFPADWSARFTYADVLVHTGPLIGHSNAETRSALQELLDLNPKLVAMWDHLVTASANQDSAQCALAVNSMIALGAFVESSQRNGMDVSLFYRLLPGGGRSARLLDSLAAGVQGARLSFPRLMASWWFMLGGLPAAQLEVNRRRLSIDPHAPEAGYLWKTTGIAWASVGAWDSALVALDRYAPLSPEEAGAVEVYRHAATGAWLGGLDSSEATARRVMAVKSLEGLLPGDSLLLRDRRAWVGWADGMLAILRRDQRGIATAREAVRQSGADGFSFMDRALAGLELQLKGDVKGAADSLSALDLDAGSNEVFGTRDPLARSVAHLAAARLLLQRGDTTRAVRLLTWHEASMGKREDSMLFQIFAPIAYFELARIEEAQGRDDLARDHYQQFLRRYERPVPAYRQLVVDAKAALGRLAGLRDAPSTR